MKVLSRISLMICLSIVAGAIFSTDAAAGYKIGVLAKRGAEKTMEQWGPTSAYLQKKLGMDIAVVPLKFVEIEPAVKAGEIDFLIANSAFYAEMHEKYKARAILTMMNQRGGRALYDFGGVVFVRKDSPIRTLSEIKGKRLMCVKFSSFGGAQMAWRMLLQNGIDPKTDTQFLEGNTHDNVVLAVKDGQADVGTVRSDTLERMQDEGKINLSEFYILNQIKDSFPFVHSTELYPEWPIATLSHVDPVVSKKVAKALMLMPTEAKAAQAAKISGWTYAADYDKVADCLREIQYGVFAKNN